MLPLQLPSSTIQSILTPIAARWTMRLSTLTWKVNQMTPEQRLDRLERIFLLFVDEGLRVRKNIRRQQANLRDQHEKINMLLDAQIKNEALFNKRFARNEERFTRTEHAIERLVAAHERTDAKLQALIDAIRGRDLGGLLA